MIRLAAYAGVAGLLCVSSAGAEDRDPRLAAPAGARRSATIRSWRISTPALSPPATRPTACG